MAIIGVSEMPLIIATARETVANAIKGAVRRYDENVMRSTRDEAAKEQEANLADQRRRENERSVRPVRKVRISSYVPAGSNAGSGEYEGALVYHGEMGEYPISATVCRADSVSESDAEWRQRRRRNEDDDERRRDDDNRRRKSDEELRYSISPFNPSSPFSIYD